MLLHESVDVGLASTAMCPTVKNPLSRFRLTN